MTLKIINPEGLHLDSFILHYIIPEIKAECFTRIDSSRCNKWTEYFKQNDLGWRRAGKKVLIPSAYDVIMSGINNITYSKQGVDYRVFINNNEIVPSGVL